MKKVIGALIVLLAVGAAIPATRARMAEAIDPLFEGIRAKVTPRKVEAIADQLDARLRLGQGLPGNWEAWLRRDYTGDVEDAWGNPWYLDTRRRGYYAVGSMGPDGEQGTDDDIRVQRELGG